MSAYERSFFVALALMAGVVGGHLSTKGVSNSSVLAATNIGNTITAERITIMDATSNDRIVLGRISDPDPKYDGQLAISFFDRSNKRRIVLGGRITNVGDRFFELNFLGQNGKDLRLVLGESEQDNINHLVSMDYPNRQRVGRIDLTSVQNSTYSGLTLSVSPSVQLTDDHGKTLAKLP
jgi:hypothetical protein